MAVIRRALPASLLVCALAARGARPPEVAVGAPLATTRGAVAAAEPLAAAAGAEILRAGGNATDAAVATAFALAVTWPEAGNLGGGGFWISRDAAGRWRTIDFRETAPRRADAAMFERAAAAGVADPSLRTPLASGVPGTVAGLWRAHRRGGRLPWARCLAPAVRLARDGFPVSVQLRASIAEEQSRLAASPPAAALLLRDGAPLPEGTLLRQPALARTLARIARRGADGFYRGPVAAALVRWSRAGGGVLDARDLAAYRPRERPPLCFPYAGHRVCTTGPPSSGVILARLAMAQEAAGPGCAEEAPAGVHCIVELEKRVFLTRNRELGDPAFARVDLKRLLAPASIRALAAGLDPARATPSATLAPSAAREHPSTTHFSVIDRRGGAVSVTYTLNDSFGSTEWVPGAGFLMNNEMDDFTAHPGQPNLFGLVQGEANAIAPGKRPVSSMSPAIATRDGRVRLIWGTPGGSTIITTNFQILWRVLGRGTPLAEAIAAPRFHQQDFPDALDREEGFPPATLAALQAMGHEPGRVRRLGFVAAIAVGEDGRRVAMGDPRRGGAAAAE